MVCETCVLHFFFIHVSGLNWKNGNRRGTRAFSVWVIVHNRYCDSYHYLSIISQYVLSAVHVYRCKPIKNIKLHGVHVTVPCLNPILNKLETCANKTSIVTAYKFLYFFNLCELNTCLIRRKPSIWKWFCLDRVHWICSWSSSCEENLYLLLVHWQTFLTLFSCDLQMIVTCI